MMKLIFLDIDGTLLDHDVLHDIPQSAKKAIKLTRQKGNKIILCTGRTKCNVKKELIDFETDGQVYGAGSHIEIENHLVSFNEIKPSIVLELGKAFEQIQAGFVLEGTKFNYCNPLAFQHFHQIGRFDPSDEQGISLKEEEYLSLNDYLVCPCPINKITFYAKDDVSLISLIKQYENQFDFIRHKVQKDGTISYECLLKGIDKGWAVHQVCHYYQASIMDTMAYGDSMNDYEMLETVHRGVAMGNAIDALKQIADDVCDKVSEDGLYKSFIHYELI